MKRSNVKRVSSPRETSSPPVRARKKKSAPESRRIGKNQLDIASAPMSNETPASDAGAEDSAQPAALVSGKERALSALPKELGVLLLTAGAVGVVLPGPGLPAMLAGALILWPTGFRKAETWFRRRFPRAHDVGVTHVERFLGDLERRYPGSTTEDNHQ